MKQFRLLEDGETIQEGDQILNDDCETWDSEYYASKQSDGRWWVGHKYRIGFHVPTRRLCEVPTEVDDK